TTNVTDLGVRMTGPTDGVSPGQTVTYVITVTNSGPLGVVGASVVDSVSPQLTNVSWTASPTGGAAGTVAGSGNLTQLVTLPSGSGITYTLTGVVAAGASGTLSNVATVTPPGTVVDPNPGSDVARSNVAILALTPAPPGSSVAPLTLAQEGSTFVVLGAPGAVGMVQFQLLARKRSSRDEVGVFRVDDAQGRIAGLLPSDPRYLRTAVRLGRWRVIFRRRQPLGSIPHPP